MEKFAENCKIYQKFGVSRQNMDKIGVQLCENLHFLKDILISFHIFFISWMKKFCLVMKLCNVILKFTMPGFPLKIVNIYIYPSELT